MLFTMRKQITHYMLSLPHPLVGLGFHGNFVFSMAKFCGNCMAQNAGNSILCVKILKNL